MSDTVRDEVDEGSVRLPVGSAGERSGGWFGCLALIVTEGSLFGYLIFSYLYLASQSGSLWPPEGLPKLGLGVANTAILLSSSVFVWLCERFVKRRRLYWAVAAMSTALVLGVIFVGIQLKEWGNHPYGLTAHLYGSLYFTITGFHLAHVAVGLVVLSLLLLWTALGYFDERRCLALTIGGLYWHFVDLVWLFIFTTIYLSPYLLRSRA
ncbi:cytochrome c oxidase subunit 3 [Paraburkholderia phymatum]|uniref:Cytochrome c oxidase subunit III n=1 Tax=Paraburkholderia phymatum (strain DSM 17167 / CIP 108236 / LMG 21445 / STM815) TaxID=391038 RepID=B2JP13_PARP8|nr:cytochrome c oxidase subunit 3 [Paraburkholderia phymatum]ACC74566.1 cytochrome c oxidase subunit III [Paraburkholderia phymatum STM815]